MSHATFSAPDMTTYCGLEDLGLVAVGMRCQGGGFVLKCRAANPAQLCPGCGRPGYSLGSRTRRLAHEPRGHQPTTLAVYVGRYHCRACSRSWCDDISQAAPPRAKLSFGALRWGLVCLIADNMSMNRIAAHLAVAWHTANEAILAYGEELLLADSTRFEGVRVIGVDEHVWRHRGGDKYATVIVDLTPVRDHTGPARLLDVVQGRSTRVLSSWLAARPQEWKDNIEIVAMDGFSGYKSAAASQLPEAVAVMGACQFVCVWGLEVGGDSVGVGGGELGEGLFPVGGGVSLDEAGVSCSFVGGFASVCEALGGAFVFDVADGEPQEFDGGFFAGEMPAVLGDFTQLVVQRFDSVGGVHDAAQHGRERQERREALPGALPGGNGLGVARSQVAGRKLFERLSGGFLIGCAVDPLEGGGDVLAVLVGHETHGRAD